MAISKIKTGSITTDAITEAKVADGAIENEHLNSNVITGQSELAEAAAGSDVLLVYDISSGALKKIQASNVGLQAPTLTSISPTSVLTGDGTGNFTFTFTGTGFVATTVPTLITEGGSDVSFDSFTIDSNTQITAVIAKSSLSDANEPYDARITVAGALTATLLNQINVDESPVFNTAAGSLGSFSEQTTISTIDIVAYDPDSTGNITFDLQSGSLPPGLSATTVNENGVSKYRITGTLSTDRSSVTTSNFTLRASDANSNTTSRAFSITEVPSGIESFTSSGTFSVPTGITAVEVLVVAGGGAGGKAPGPGGGGGAGAGGLIFVPAFPVTPGGTVTVTVGCGGIGAYSTTAKGATGQDSAFGTLTAKGGGGGGGAIGSYACGINQNGGDGGSGGGGAGNPGGGGGCATQPTQPGQSGAYGFGNNGFGWSGNGKGGGGGGGAGAAGACSAPIPYGGPDTFGGKGGAGKAYTIADGTTPVLYAGGGGGGGGPAGGWGGAGADFFTSAGGRGSPFVASQSGQANRGAGGGGAGNATCCQASGGKGIVIVKY